MEKFFEVVENVAGMIARKLVQILILAIYTIMTIVYTIYWLTIELISGKEKTDASIKTFAELFKKPNTIINLFK